MMCFSAAKPFQIKSNGRDSEHDLFHHFSSQKNKKGLSILIQQIKFTRPLTTNSQSGTSLSTQQAWLCDSQRSELTHEY